MRISRTCVGIVIKRGDINWNIINIKITLDAIKLVKFT